MRRRIAKILMVLAGGLMLFPGCGDVVIKVKKNAKNSELQSKLDKKQDGLNLTVSDDFLKDLDSLKSQAASMVIAELIRQDYRTKFRSAIRNYREFLIKKGSGTVKIDDSFYFGDKDCRDVGLNFNVEDGNAFLGIILKTAVLAKLSEVSATNLNAKLSKDLEAIIKIIQGELGVKIDGTSDVSKDENGLTLVKTKVTIQILPLDADKLYAGEEPEDAETLQKDKDEIMTLEFERKTSDDYVGYFDAKISITHKVGDKMETLEAIIKVEREKVDGKFKHTLTFLMGKEGIVPHNYSRKVVFEQVDGSKSQLQITDTINFEDTENAKTFVTVLDIEAGTQCKVKLDPKDPVADDDDDKEPYPGDDDDDNKPVGDDDDDDTVKPTGDDDDDGKIIIDDPTQKPSQNHPGQKPGQKPTQN